MMSCLDTALAMFRYFISNNVNHNHPHDHSNLLVPGQEPSLDHSATGTHIERACPVKSGELLALVNKSFYYIQLELLEKVTANW